MWLIVALVSMVNSVLVDIMSISLECGTFKRSSLVEVGPRQSRNLRLVWLNFVVSIDNDCSV